MANRVPNADSPADGRESMESGDYKLGSAEDLAYVRGIANAYGNPARDAPPAPEPEPGKNHLHCMDGKELISLAEHLTNTRSGKLEIRDNTGNSERTTSFSKYIKRIEEGVRSKLNDVVLVKRSVLQRLVHDFKQQNANLQMATKKIEDQDRKYKSAMDQMQELGRKIKELDHDKDTLKRRVYALSDDLYDERQENQKLRSESARRY